MKNARLDRKEDIRDHSTGISTTKVYTRHDNCTMSETEEPRSRLMNKLPPRFSPQHPSHQHSR